MNKLGPVWPVIQFIWSIRRIIAILGMIVTIIYLLAGETLEHRRTMLATFSDRNELVALRESELKILGDAVYRGPSIDGRSVSKQEADNLYGGVQNLTSSLAAISPPNREIELAISNYRRSLTTLQGALNLFSVGEEGTIKVLSALEDIEIPAKNYHNAVKRYETSVWRSFWAAF